MTGLRSIRRAKAEEAHRYAAATVAKAMGVSRVTYAKWEEHPEKMSVGQARKLADYLGCSVDDLFYLPEDVN